ncbi:MAG TPA: hypothetical protein VLH77_00565 [Gammaproteobacteria bacterium]|nr:hypothetical protein [Gammaproteobacteria bacterium]
MRIAVFAPAPSYPALDIRAAIQRVGMEAFDFSWATIQESDDKTEAYVLLADSPKDWLHPAAQSLIQLLHEKSRQGKPILGLGYGSTSLLVDQGLIPGLFKNMVGLKLEENLQAEKLPLETWARLAPDYQYNAFTQVFPPQLFLPVCLKTAAQFVIPPGLLMEVKAQGLNVFLYCDALGHFQNETSIAALANKAGTVMAMLPHPEKTLACDLLFASLQAYLQRGYREQVEPLYYWPRK